MCLFAIIACVYAAPKPQYFAAEAFDTALVRDERLGGNFAYSSIEGPAYKSYAPFYRSYASPATLLEQRPYTYQDFGSQYYGGFAFNPYRFY